MRAIPNLPWTALPPTLGVSGKPGQLQTVRSGLATATFAQRRLLVELLIDRVVVTDGEVEIRYVLPTSPDGPHPLYCQLRKDHRQSVLDAALGRQVEAVTLRVSNGDVLKTSGVGQSDETDGV